jgi:hypothetical protein
MDRERAVTRAARHTERLVRVFESRGRQRYTFASVR